MAAHPTPPPPPARNCRTLLDDYRHYYNTHRRHSALPRRTTPAQAWTHAPSLGGPASLPVQTDATLHRCLVGSTGAIGVAGTPHQRRHAPTPAPPSPPSATAAAITIYDPDGQPIGHFHLTPDRTYISLTRAA